MLSHVSGQENPMTFSEQDTCLLNMKILPEDQVSFVSKAEVSSVQPAGQNQRREGGGGMNMNDFDTTNMKETRTYRQLSLSLTNNTLHFVCLANAYKRRFFCRITDFKSQVLVFAGTCCQTTR